MKPIANLVLAVDQRLYDLFSIVLIGAGASVIVGSAGRRDEYELLGLGLVVAARPGRRVRTHPLEWLAPCAAASGPPGLPTHSTPCSSAESRRPPRLYAPGSAPPAARSGPGLTAQSRSSQTL